MGLWPWGGLCRNEGTLAGVTLLQGAHDRHCLLLTCLQTQAWSVRPFCSMLLGLLCKADRLGAEPPGTAQNRLEPPGAGALAF